MNGGIEDHPQGSSRISPKLEDYYLEFISSNFRIYRYLYILIYVWSSRATGSRCSSLAI